MSAIGKWSVHYFNGGSLETVSAAWGKLHAHSKIKKYSRLAKNEEVSMKILATTKHVENEVGKMKVTLERVEVKVEDIKDKVETLIKIVHNSGGK